MDNIYSGRFRFIIEKTWTLRTLTIALMLFLQLALDLRVSSAVSRSCPIFCQCYPVKGPDEGALQAVCDYELEIIPSLTTNVTRLTIKTKTLTVLDDFAFADAKFLRNVILYVDNLNRISRFSFERMETIESVKIGSKRAIDIEPGAFLIKSLTSLALKAALRHVPPGLCGASNLRVLNVDENAITSATFPPCMSEVINLYRVSLSRNPLGAVHGSDFYHLKNTNLTEMYMSQCGLAVLPSDILKYLPMVKVLDLSENRVSHIPSDMFIHARHINTLDVSGTLLQGAPTEQTQPFMKTLISLSYSHCKSMNISFNNRFLNATSLQLLALEGTRIGRLTDSTFTSLLRSPVTKITLQESSIREVEAGSLGSLLHLQDLNMYQNPMSEEAIHNASFGIADSLKILKLGGYHAITVSLNNNTFEGFSPANSLSVLSLQNIDALKIKTHSFSPFKNLTRLLLSGNRLTLADLEENAFEGLDLLQSLTLDNNRLVAIPKISTIGSLPSLQYLSLRYNAIGSVQGEDFRGYEGLAELHLTNNRLKTLLTGTFQTLRSLETLNLEGNLISSVRLAAFKGLDNLSNLLLNTNRLSAIARPAETLSLGRLEILRLSRNPDFKNLEQDIVSGVSQLRILEIESCEIENLPLGLFLNNGNLTELVLSGNAISTWESNLFQPLAALKELILNDNQITNLNEMSFVCLVSLRVLSLARNPLACNCDLLWFKHWVNNIELNLIEYGNEKSYTCFSPGDMRGVPLHKFSLSPVDCSSNLALHLVIAVTVVTALACSLIAVVYRYWWYFRYYAFLLMSRRRQKRDELLDAEAFQYDVYVCYHRSSRRWVIEQLVPELENNGGLKLCLHDRDWFPGRTILDNVVESIETSRKILLLVNNGFALSGWCREETVLAHTRLVEEECNLLLAVLLEEIDQENMHRTLRSLLASRTYLAWPAGAKREAKFWKALRRALRRAEHPTAGVEM